MTANWRTLLRIVAPLWLPYLGLVFLCIYVELVQRGFTPSLLNVIELMRRHMAPHVAFVLLFLATMPGRRKAFQAALHSTLWAALAANVFMRHLSFVLQILVSGYASTYYLYDYFFSLDRAWEAFLLYGPFPAVLFVLHWLTLSLLPVFWWRYRRAPGGDLDVPRKKAAITAIVLLAVSLVPTVGFDDGLGTILSRSLSPPGSVVEFTSPYFEGETHPFEHPDVELKQALSEPNFRHVAVIILESTGATATTLHDPELATTPFLATLAEKSVVANYAYTPVTHTMKAFVSILCGIFPFPHMEVAEKLPGAIPVSCLPKTLAPSGYETVFWSSSWGYSEGAEGVAKNMGFSEIYTAEDLPSEGFEKPNAFGYEDDVMLAPAAEWLKSRQESKTFSVFLTNTPHHEYGVPSRYELQHFVDDDKQNNYLNTLYYVDKFLGKLVGVYRDLGMYQDTLFVVVGDHGEGFGQHGLWIHGAVPFEEVVRVPLLFHAVGLAAQRLDHAVTQLDVTPTIVELLGFDVRNDPYDGVSIIERDDSRSIIALGWFEKSSVAVIRGQEKYVFSFGEENVVLYDMVEDPGERNPLLVDGPAAQALRAEVRRWYLETDARWREHFRAEEVDLLWPWP